jgi:L-2,4-diaminobutyrate transaminase
MRDTETKSLEKADQNYFIHPNTDLKDFASGALGAPTIISYANGIRIRDQNGRELIDAFASLWNVNIGYGRREIADAMHAQALQMAYYHTHGGFSNVPAIQLSDRVRSWFPKGLQRVFWGLQGSDAHETQVKMIWYYNNVLGRPKKKKLIARDRAYHGMTIMSGSLSGIPHFHQMFDLPLDQVKHVSAPYYFRREDRSMSEEAYSASLAAELEALIEREGPDTIAAFFAEPVMGMGGVLPSPKGYWEAIVPILKKHEILLISDEVMTGFGRLGRSFGCDLYGYSPDMLTISKGLTSGYFPVAGSVISDEIWAVLQEGSERTGSFAHGFTYVAHPLGAAVALKNLEILESEGLVDNSAKMGRYLLERLRSVFGDHPLVGDIRGVGLLACIELVEDRDERRFFDPERKVGRRFAKACLDEGVIVRPLPDGDMIAFAPPLIVTEKDVDEIVECTKRAFHKICKEL